MVGIGVYDFVCKDQYDSETGTTYKALCCCNDDDMAIRCKVKDARKVVWSVKATASFNNEICVLLRNGFQNGKIDLLVSEQDAEEVLKDTIKGYANMSVTEQTYLKMPYAQTSMGIFELIKLDHEIKNGQIRVKEASGMRKDRYSSMAYSFWCVTQLELKLRPHNNDVNLYEQFKVRAPKKVTRF